MPIDCTSPYQYYNEAKFPADTFQFSNVISLDEDPNILDSTHANSISDAIAKAVALGASAQKLILIDCGIGQFDMPPNTVVPSGVFFRGYGVAGWTNSSVRLTEFRCSTSVASSLYGMSFSAVSGASNIAFSVSSPPSNYNAEFGIVRPDDTSPYPVVAYFQGCTFFNLGNYVGANKLVGVSATGGIPSLGAVILSGCYLNMYGTSTIGLKTHAQGSINDSRIVCTNGATSIVVNTPGDYFSINNTTFNDDPVSSPSNFLEVVSNSKVSIRNSYIPEGKILYTGTPVGEVYYSNPGFSQSLGRSVHLSFADTPYALSRYSMIVYCDTSAGSIQLDLPLIADSVKFGETPIFEVIKISTDANTVSVSPSSPNTVNGLASPFVINNSNKRAVIASDGTGWYAG